MTARELQNRAISAFAEQATTVELLAEIGRLQNLQKSVGPKHPDWDKWSANLAPLFAEMARREPSARAALAAAERGTK